MKKLNKAAAVTTAAVLLITNSAAAAENSSTYTYFGSLSEICETEDSNSDFDTHHETPANILKPSAETDTFRLPETKPPVSEEKQTSETTTNKPPQPSAFPLFEHETKEYITETETVSETSTETTTQETVETTTSKPVQTTTEVITETQPETTTAAQVSNTANNTSTARQILNLVNEERAAAGLSALTLDSSLTDAAQLKAQDMADNNYFSHTSPTYGTPFQMLSSLGISYKTAGENIAKGQKSADAVMTAWMNSEGHKANILNSGYGKLGVGYVNQNGTTYWVQIFTD